jgi:YggT family protein
MPRPELTLSGDMSILAALLDFCSLVVFVAVILSWIPAARENAFGRTIASVTEPVFERIRAVLPPFGGFDLSPMLVLFALRFARSLIG